MRQAIRAVAVAASALLMLTGCAPAATPAAEESSTVSSQTEYPITVTDFDGVSVTIEERPERVVMAGMWMPIEMMSALGLEDSVVGTVENNINRGWPEFVTEVASVGGSPLSVESVVELTPDLVIATNIDSDIRTQLEGMGIDVLLVPAHVIDQNPAQYRLLGEVFDVSERAEEAATYIEDRWAEVETALASVKDADKPRIYFESGMTTGATNAFKTLGVGSGTDVLINLAAGVNIAADLADGATAPEVSSEWIVAENPDVIVSYAPNTMLGWEPDLDAAESLYDEIITRPGFDQISAVQDGRVLLIPSGIMSDPLNPVGLFYLASFLHPELVSAERAAEVHEEMLDLFFDTEYGGTWTYTR